MKINIFLIIVFLCFSCNKVQPRKPINPKPSSTLLRSTAKQTKALNTLEDKKIEQLILNDSLAEYHVSKNGFWYTYIRKKEGSFPLPKLGNEVSFEYEITDLNDSIIYSKEELGIINYKVDKEDFISAIQKGIKFKRDDIAFMHEKLLSLKPEDVGFYDYCSEIYDKYSGKNYNHDVDFDNVMVYEVKKSAADNFEDLIHDNGKYFYWNQKKFTNLNMNDYVFLINTTNKYSSFLKLNKKDINIKIKGNNSSFTDEGQKFNVGGKYKKFVRLEIVESLEKDYDWKTLGVSENTFLYGKHCEGLNSANIQRINHLKDIYKKNTKAIEILDTCLNGHEK